jgi:DNA mismatch endonuclease, patch repair protein
MARIRSKHTSPEMKVRRLAYRLGYRFRLHANALPGRPDLVFPARRKVVLVQGCFWHQHPDPKCRLARQPKSRLDYWGPKLEGNRKRDLRQQVLLRESGWTFLEVWECEVVDEDCLAERLRTFLGPTKSSKS